MSYGQMLEFMQYIALLIFPLRNLGMTVAFGQRAAAALLRVNEVLSTSPEITDPRKPVALATDGPTGAVRFQHVTFGYDAEPPHPRNPLWKRFKRPAHFVDRTFRKFLEYLQSAISGEKELVLNGDIFDFDSVMARPDDDRFHVSWLERARGLNAEESKSRFKMSIILRDHSIWVEALREFVRAGNRLVFVIGNHDMELHWPSVRRDLVAGEVG
jgi:ABC-type multidrug transport system fused ATPase/permease subunit